MNNLRKNFIQGLSLFLLAVTTFAATPARKGLVLNLQTVDLLGETAHKVITNSPSLVSMAKTHQLSYCVWIKPTSIPSEFPVLLSKGGNNQPDAYGGYEFVLNSNGDSDLLFVSGRFLAKTRGGLINPNVGQWIHVAFAIDLESQTEQFYVNGEPVQTSIASGTFADINFDVRSNLYVGAPDPASDRNRANFDGKMRELMLFNRALSADEIQTIFSISAHQLVPNSPPDVKRSHNTEAWQSSKKSLTSGSERKFTLSSLDRSLRPKSSYCKFINGEPEPAVDA